MFNIKETELLTSIITEYVRNLYDDPSYERLEEFGLLEEILKKLDVDIWDLGTEYERGRIIKLLLNV